MSKKIAIHLLIAYILTFLTVSEYSLLYQQNIQNQVLDASFNPTTQFLCYQQKYDPPRVIVKNRPSTSLNYSDYADFIFNASQQERKTFNDKLSISKTGKYIGGVINDEDFVYIYSYNDTLETYEFFKGINSMKANKTTINNIYFNPGVDEEIAFVTNGFVEMRNVDGSQVQVLEGAGKKKNTASYSMSGKYFITGESSINLYKRSESSIFEPYQVISLEDEALAICISPDQQYIGVSTENKIKIYKFVKDHDHFQIFQLLDQSCNYLKFGWNSETLSLIKDEEMSVYRKIGQNYIHTQSIQHPPNTNMISNQFNDLVGFSDFTFQFYGYCSTLYCSKCERQASTCQTCLQEYYLLNQKTCISCTGLRKGCVSCSAKDYCDNCLKEYTVYEGACVYCNIENCLTCRAQSECFECKTGYDMSNNKCIESGGSGSSAGLIVGLVFGILILIISAAGGTLYCKKRGKKDKKQSLLEADAQND